MLNQIKLLLSSFGFMLLCSTGLAQERIPQLPSTDIQIHLNIEFSGMTTRDFEIWNKVRSNKPLTIAEKLTFLGESYTVKLPDVKITYNINTLEDLDNFFALREEFSGKVNTSFGVKATAPKLRRGGKAGLMAAGAATLLSLGAGQTRAETYDEDIEYMDVEVAE